VSPVVSPFQGYLDGVRSLSSAVINLAAFSSQLFHIFYRFGALQAF
jgi:hypothetical protein